MHYIIATHDKMSAGIADAIRILYGNIENLTVLEAYVESDNFDVELENVLKTIDQDEKIIVLTDLLSGSVNQAAIKKMRDRNLEIITGINLPLVLNLLKLDETKDIQKQIREAVENAKEQLIFINTLIK